MKKGDSGCRVKTLGSRQFIAAADLFELEDGTTMSRPSLHPETLLSRWKRLINVIDR